MLYNFSKIYQCNLILKTTTTKLQKQNQQQITKNKQI